MKETVQGFLKVCKLANKGQFLNTTHKSVGSHRSWFMLFSCQRFCNRVYVYFLSMSLSMWLVDHRYAISQEKRKIRANVFIREINNNDNDDDIYRE